MSILTAIFQAIGQALTWIFPISESGHSAIFHNFAGRYTNACSQLTGVIHIGIALGIIITFYKLFFKLFKNFFDGWNDLFHKRLDVKNSSSVRKFEYMTIASFVPLILYIIPAGKYTNLFSLIHSTSYDNNLLIEGICILLTGVLIAVTAKRMNVKVNPLPQIFQALLLGFAVLFALALPGGSVVGAVLCIGILTGMSYKISFRYSMVMSVMLLLVSGVIELCVAVTPVSIVSAVIAVIISAACTYLFIKLFSYIIKKGLLKYVAWYDVALGGICLVTGLFQIIAK